MYDWMWDDGRDSDRPATEAEIHAQWHMAMGWPMNRPGCPWDCCDPPEHEDDRDDLPVVFPPKLGPDDIPF